MKLLKKSYLLVLPLMLLTSCENKVFSLSAEELYLPEPTKIAFTLNESTECALNEDDTLTFYQKYLKDLDKLIKFIMYIIMILMNILIVKCL